jgi:hypothetical protein
MAIELAGIQLSKITGIKTLEQTGFVRYAVPGMEGELTQNLGRPSVRLQIQGIHYGPDAEESLEQLREMHFKKDPVEFLADIIGKSFFSLVVLNRFEVLQKASAPDQYSFLMEIVEYKEPPKPVLLDTKGVDLGILSEAASFMNAFMLPDMLALPEISDPTVPMKGMLDEVLKTMEPVENEESTLIEIFGTT